MSMLFAALLPSCFLADGAEFVPPVNPDHPPVQNLGELTITDVSEVLNSEDVYYGTLGPSDPGQNGGATATFIGTGGDVCVLVDPEAVFWIQAITGQSPDEAYTYPDNPYDDGDLDLEVGLSAFYNGSPGVEMGNFEALYEDSLGNEVYIEFNECIQYDWYGQTGSHAGRATPEFCTIDTSAHPGKEYTIVLNTWSLPLNDYLLNFAVVVFDGDCETGLSAGFTTESPSGTTVTISSGYPAVECFLSNEAQDGDGDFSELEKAFCANEQTWYCCDYNPDNPYCDDEPINDDNCIEEYIDGINSGR
jgi:hypothetical protein